MKLIGNILIKLSDYYENELMKREVNHIYIIFYLNLIFKLLFQIKLEQFLNDIHIQKFDWELVRSIDKLNTNFNFFDKRQDDLVKLFNSNLFN